MVVDLRGGANHSAKRNVVKAADSIVFSLMLFCPWASPKHLEQDHSDHRINIDTIDIAADTGGKQRLHQLMVEIEENIVAP